MALDQSSIVSNETGMQYRRSAARMSADRRTRKPAPTGQVADEPRLSKSETAQDKGFTGEIIDDRRSPT